MANARPVHEAVSVIRAKKFTVQEFYKYLTKNGTNFEYEINGASLYGGMTILHAACAAGNVDVVRELLSKGAAINTKTDAGRTPLIEAIDARNLECVKLLLQSVESISDEANLVTALNETTDEIRQCVNNFLQNATMLAFKTKLQELIKEIEKMIAVYKLNGAAFFNIGNNYKALHLQSALTSASSKMNSFTTIDEFLNYKEGDNMSINDALAIPRIGFSSPTSKNKIDEMVSGFKNN